MAFRSLLSTGNADANSTFIATVNGYTNQTGVVAATNSVGITLTRSGGGNITIGETTASVGLGDYGGNLGFPHI